MLELNLSQSSRSLSPQAAGFFSGCQTVSLALSRVTTDSCITLAALTEEPQSHASYHATDSISNSAIKSR